MYCGHREKMWDVSAKLLNDSYKTRDVHEQKIITLRLVHGEALRSMRSGSKLRARDSTQMVRILTRAATPSDTHTNP